MAFATGPLLNIGIDLFPAAQVKIAYAEIRAVRQAEGVLERGEKGLLDVIENAGHKLRSCRRKISWILRKLGSSDKGIVTPAGLADYGMEKALPNTPCAKPRRIKFNDVTLEFYLVRQVSASLSPASPRSVVMGSVNSVPL